MGGYERRVHGPLTSLPGELDRFSTKRGQLVYKYNLTQFYSLLFRFLCSPYLYLINHLSSYQVVVL
jgi:hypothetical protein